MRADGLMTDGQIKRWLGSGEGNRKVRVLQDGCVEYYGSRDYYDRDHDYWHCFGSRKDYPVSGDTAYHA